jgi:hypothetical protein
MQESISALVVRSDPARSSRNSAVRGPTSATGRLVPPEYAISLPMAPAVVLMEHVSSAMYSNARFSVARLTAWVQPARRPSAPVPAASVTALAARTDLPLARDRAGHFSDWVRIARTPIASALVAKAMDSAPK